MNKEYTRKYYQEHKKQMKDQAKEWYKSNKERKHELNMESKKKNNYKDEKSQGQREIRNIKRKTRLNHLLFKVLKCEFCPSGATEHHHYTRPIQTDKFNYICNNCHNQLNSREVK
jgi:hypothetical protein